MDTISNISDKKRIKWLEENTTPFLNLIPFELAVDNEFHRKITDLTKWEFRFGLSASFTQRTLKTKLSDLLGAKWSYCVNYDYQNAVWGFNFGKRKIGIVVYYSKNGTSFQVEDRISTNELLDLIDVLHNKLYKTKIKI